MSKFDDIIRARKKQNDEKFISGMVNLTNMAMGKNIKDAMSNRDSSEAAMTQILNSFGIKGDGRRLPGGIIDPDEIMEYMLRPYGIMRRPVKLDSRWYKDADGTLLTTLRDSGKMVVIHRSKSKGFCYLNPETNKEVSVNRRNAHLFDDEGIEFYKSFPIQKLTVRDYLFAGFQYMRVKDIVLIVVSMLLTAVMGALVPVASRFIFKDLLPVNQLQMLYYSVAFILCSVIGKYLIEIFENTLMAQMNQRVSFLLYTAGMMRTLTMDSTFFSEFSAGELMFRVRCFKDDWKCVMDIVFKGLAALIFQIVFIVEIAMVTPVLSVLAIIILIAAILITINAILIKAKILDRQFQISAKNTQTTYSMFNSMRKIRLCGAEERMFEKWAAGYATETQILYDPPVFLKVCEPILSALSLFGMVEFFILASNSNLASADYFAFASAFGMAFGAVLSVFSISDSFAQLMPGLKMIQPILSTIPEISPKKNVVSSLSGSINLVNVSFRYNEDMPYVIKDLSLEINPGDYVAICGTTGCGKSTLLRLLLGIETPSSGEIYYDNRNISEIDIKSLRQNIGTVLQNGQLIAGSILDNILFGTEKKSLEIAWEAAEIAGIADDIRALPMQMQTYLAEGNGGISGGQKQRILIARAIASKPEILIFDEATSALDNVSQKKISSALDSFNCTRIVVAHRLSTIQNCNRILVMDNGNIVENGTYDELLAMNGIFADLVKRQQV